MNIKFENWAKTRQDKKHIRLEAAGGATPSVFIAAVHSTETAFI